MLLKNSWVHLTIVMTLSLGGQVANAQSTGYSTAKKDTVSVFGDRLKITLLAGTFEKIPNDISAQKYARVFNLHDVTNSTGFALRKNDTLVFYATSIDRPPENDGGISIWQIINSILDKASAYRMESGWNKMGSDYLYYVKLVLDKKPDHFFEFNFFFVENKLMLSLLERPLKELTILEQESFTVVLPR